MGHVLAELEVAWHCPCCIIDARKLRCAVARQGLSARSEYMEDDFEAHITQWVANHLDDRCASSG